MVIWPILNPSAVVVDDVQLKTRTSMPEIFGRERTSDRFRSIGRRLNKEWDFGYYYVGLGR